MIKLSTTVFFCCLLALPVAVAAQSQPIEGHQNLRLGMTIEQALAAEPRAKRTAECNQHGCLRYFDRRFLGTGFQVLADFGDQDSLQTILMSAVLAGGGAVRCADFYRNAVKDYTREHGAPESITQGVVIWQDASAVITVSDDCAGGDGGTVAVVINRRHR
jgi:hypothetical protein